VNLLKDFRADHMRPILRFTVLAAVSAIASAVNLILTSGDNRPPPWDFAYYLEKSLEF
jgi:hypothetical protein